MDKYLSRGEASRFLAGLGLSIAPSTLAKYATIGGGPEFRRFGRQVKYLPDDLLAWARGRLSGPVRSTSEFTEPDVDDLSSSADNEASGGMMGAHVEGVDDGMSPEHG